MTARMKKYYAEHPLCEVYRGWNIRMHTYESRWLGTQTEYTVDVRVGVESCSASTIEWARQFVDKKIAEGKIQREDA